MHPVDPEQLAAAREKRDRAESEVRSLAARFGAGEKVQNELNAAIRLRDAASKEVSNLENLDPIVLGIPPPPRSA